MTLRVGLDFDNTLIDYDQVFGKVLIAEAARREISLPVSVSGKQAVKQAAIQLAGETFWMAIQGQAYGRGIVDGQLIPGVADFLTTARDHQAEIFIVSHKTVFGHFDDSRTNLRTAARGWMDEQGFFDPRDFAIQPSRLFFEATLEAKIARIRSLNLDYFIDDLEKVLTAPNFPEHTCKIWFNPQPTAPRKSVTLCADWATIQRSIFGHD
jgi:hypothetical protein